MMTGMKGKKNRYICTCCNCTIVTVDIDEGTTPYLLLCHATPGCPGMMLSQWYQGAESLEPSWEFYRPSPEEYIQLPMSYKAHVENGGLLLRKIGETTDPVPAEFAAQLGKDA